MLCRVAPCGTHKKSPCTSFIMQIIFSFLSFEVSEGILNYQKLIIGLVSFSKMVNIHVCIEEVGLSTYK